MLIFCPSAKKCALLLLASCSFIVFSANAQYGSYKRYYNANEPRTKTLSINYNFNTSVHEKSTSYNYAKGISAEFEAPFSTGNDNIGQYISGFANIGTFSHPNDIGDPNRSQMFLAGNLGMRLSTYFWNSNGTVALRPYFNIGINYRSQDDTFDPGNNLAVRAGVGADIVLSGQYLDSQFLQKFDIVFVNNLSVDTRKGRNTANKYTVPGAIETGMKVVYKW